MSTRSGKRRHNSFHENLLKPDVEHVAESDRKTRSRRMKENVEEFSLNILKNKNRVNYVSYPTEDEVTDTVDSKEDEGKPTSLLRKNTLKEQNMVTSSSDGVKSSADVKKAVRTTRRTRKFAEDNPEDVPETRNHVEEVEIKKSKGKKKIQAETEPTFEEVVITKKKSKKKKLKKGRRSGSMIVEDIEPDNGVMNKSNMSIDSFHSAAGSPKHLQDGARVLEKPPQKDLELVNATFEKNDDEEVPPEKPARRQTRSASRLSTANISLNTPNKVVKETRKRKSRAKLEQEDGNIEDTELIPLRTMDQLSKKRKSSVKDTVTIETKVDTTFDKEMRDSTLNLDDLEKRKSIKNSTFDKIETTDKINTTYDKDDNTSETTKSKVDTTLDKNAICDEQKTTHGIETENDGSNSTTKRQKSKSLINTTYEKSANNSLIDLAKDAVTQKNSTVINTTYDKDANTETVQEMKTRGSSIRDTTYDKDAVQSEVLSDSLNNDKSLRKSILSVFSQKLSTDLNTTFDKTEKSDSTFDKDKKLDATFDKSSKSSLITLDNSNITLDKSDVSRISITSDDSKENIVNTTPVLIESSMDESQVTVIPSPNSPVQAPLTPLKREGTFTKDEPEVLEPPKLSRTPTKRMSLPSPGCTPFHANKSASREPMVLNVTRSIEKSRRSSLAEPLPRTTKVMFCSPVNNPAVVLQQRRKVIKSNLKGSNKSFIFEESEPRAERRKRSYTQSDADDARAKRKRLVDGLQHSVDRMSRPRTASASGKLAEPVTPKRTTTPSKKVEARVPRTKLPNFAALHQREFDKMESLDQCQERKAKRARQLLTPTGAVTVLERSSPRETTIEPEKSPTDPPKKESKEPKEAKKQKQPKETKKPETPVKSLPTFKSLNPGYTRFGFKLNLDINPFSVPSKSDARNQSVFSFSSRKDSKAKASLSFSTKKDKDNSKPLKEIKANWRHTALPSRAGTTSVRREAAKQAVMREKSFTDKRNVTRNENRTVIKGVRTNRRFELQMRMRNID